MTLWHTLTVPLSRVKQFKKKSYTILHCVKSGKSADLICTMMEAGNHECIVLIAVTVLLRFCLLYLLCNLESYELFLRLFLYVVPAYQTNIHKLQHHQHFHPGHWKCGDTQGHPGVWQDVGAHRVILVCDKMWGHTGSSWCVTRCGDREVHPGVWQNVGTERFILVCDKMWGQRGSSWCVTKFFWGDHKWSFKKQ